MKSPSYKIFTIHDLFLLIFFLGFVSLLSVSFFTFNENNKVIWYMSQKKYEEAGEILLKNLNKDIFSLLYRFNLAFNYTLSSQYEKSINEYQTIKRLVQDTEIKNNNFYLQNPITQPKNESTNQITPTDEILFYISFNSAIASTQKQETNRALNFYQQALDSYPKSLETKVNIELLLKNSDKKSQQNQKQVQNEEKNSVQQNQQEEDSTQEMDQEPQQNTLNKDNSPSENKKESSEKESKLKTLENQESVQRKGEKTQVFNKQQIEAILKSIQDQEKEIKKKQLEDQKQPFRQNPGNTKDW